ncbi:MAG: twin-arginine translocase TatA/TatE family subunit [Bacteroidales bacterium]|jgi:sec-independent protein translocase protein TatA|nr:twin-arginine translocase TatA/TatE family subunit [Bacteroidales bacterium]
MGTLLFLGIGTQEIILIALIVLLFFGGRKIPEMMRGLGKGVKSFKDGINGINDNKGEKEQEEKTNSEDAKE